MESTRAADKALRAGRFQIHENILHEAVFGDGSCAGRLHKLFSGMIVLAVSCHPIRGFREYLAVSDRFEPVEPSCPAPFYEVLCSATYHENGDVDCVEFTFTRVENPPPIGDQSLAILRAVRSLRAATEVAR